MPSKGIEIYTYIASPGCSVEASVPGQTIQRTELRRFEVENLEVDSKNVSGLLDQVGRFSFKVLYNGEIVTEQWADVSAITGQVKAGSLAKISETPSILDDHRGLVVSYGFYAAGSGRAGLPNRHQCYVTVVPSFASWQGEVAPEGSPLAERPLSRLVLPAPHDVGMNSMESCQSVLAHAGAAVVGTLLKDSRLAEKMAVAADAVSARAVAAIAPDIVASLAITQKDSLPSMLQMGARYFEFRPAHCHEAILPTNALPAGLYFQHSVIPGMAYVAFLRDIATFLAAHPLEIVVVQLRWDGVPQQCRHPAAEEMAKVLQDVIVGPIKDLDVSTSLDDLAVPIAQLRRDHKRLFVLRDLDVLSTYTDEGNATLTGDSIVTGFASALNPDAARSKALIAIQCQATASNIPAAVAYSVASASASTSCLLATKAICDTKTLPWVRDHALQACGIDRLVVLMNDFFDGATADTAIELSRRRLEA